MADTIRSQVLRLAVRSKIEAGVDRRLISMLIHQFVKPRGSQVERIAVERIPEPLRAAFLEGLNQLKSST